MKIIRLRRVIAFVGLLGFAVAARPAQAGSSAPPNILYILADDMGYADAGFMGCKEIHTPQIDALAKEAMILDDFYGQPVCSPTRATLMTGRYVAHTGIYSIVPPQSKGGVPLSERMLPQALHDAGYETALVGKWHLGRSAPAQLPTHRGFDHQYGNWLGMIDYFTHKRGSELDWHRDDQICNDSGYSTFLDADEACRLIDAKPQQTPLFLYLAFNAVHTPLMAPQEYIERYSNLKGQRQKYAAVTAAMDDSIGKVIDALKKKGIYDNTLIIFSSDNGGPAPGVITDNGPLRAGKGTVYEGGVRLLAFAHWPGHIPVGHTREPVHMIDWYPTLVKLAGGSIDPAVQKLPLDGTDIWPTLTAAAKSPHDALLLNGTDPRQAAIRMGDYKLLLNANEHNMEETSKAQKFDGNMQLFNLIDDIGEKKDLAAAQPDRVKQLRARLDEYIKTFAPRQDSLPSDAPNKGGGE